MLSIRFTFFVSLFWFIHFCSVSRVAHHFLASHFIFWFTHFPFISLISMSPPVNRFISIDFQCFYFRFHFDYLTRIIQKHKCRRRNKKKKQQQQPLINHCLIRQIFRITYFRRFVVFLSKIDEFSIIQNENYDKIYINTIPSTNKIQTQREKSERKIKHKNYFQKIMFIEFTVMRLTSWCKNLNGIIRFMEIMAKSVFSNNLISFDIDIMKYAYVSLK